jgi:hypothetical protein
MGKNVRKGSEITLTEDVSGRVFCNGDPTVIKSETILYVVAVYDTCFSARTEGDKTGAEIKFSDGGYSVTKF